MMMPDVATPRLRGWHFLLFNLVLGLAHMAVLFNAASYIAFSSRSLDGDGDRSATRWRPYHRMNTKPTSMSTNLPQPIRWRKILFWATSSRRTIDWRRSS